MHVSEQVLTLIKKCYTSTFDQPELNQELCKLILDIEAMNIIISTDDEWIEVADDQHLLECLRANGVDSWQGYELAQKMKEEEGSRSWKVNDG
jgi:hypothetical protein